MLHLKLVRWNINQCFGICFCRLKRNASLQSASEKVVISADSTEYTEIDISHLQATNKGRFHVKIVYCYFFLDVDKCEKISSSVEHDK